MLDILVFLFDIKRTFQNKMELVIYPIITSLHNPGLLNTLLCLPFFIVQIELKRILLNVFPISRNCLLNVGIGHSL